MSDHRDLGEVRAAIDDIDAQIQRLIAEIGRAHV